MARPPRRAKRVSPGRQRPVAHGESHGSRTARRRAPSILRRPHRGSTRACRRDLAGALWATTLRPRAVAGGGPPPRPPGGPPQPKPPTRLAPPPPPPIELRSGGG